MSYLIKKCKKNLKKRRIFLKTTLSGVFLGDKQKKNKKKLSEYHKPFKSYENSKNFKKSENSKF
jgi:hypothetical protein